MIEYLLIFIKKNLYLLKKKKKKELELENVNY